MTTTCKSGGDRPLLYILVILILAGVTRVSKKLDRLIEHLDVPAESESESP